MDTRTITILQWVGTVLAAGFIAQFGKMFAEYLVKRRRNRKKGETGTQKAVIADSDEKNEKDKEVKELQKLLKKQEKAEYKKRKKLKK